MEIGMGIVIILTCRAPVISSCPKRYRPSYELRCVLPGKHGKRCAPKQNNMAKRPVLDTAACSPFTHSIQPPLPTALLPSIVFYELAATSIDEGTLKKYTRCRQALTQINRVL